MDKMIELELTLMSGDRYYLCDRSFVVISETRRNYDLGVDYNGAGVNGIAVVESYDHVVSMIRKAKGDDRLTHRSMGEIDWQCDEGICEHTDRVAGKCACYNKGAK